MMKGPQFVTYILYKRQYDNIYFYKVKCEGYKIKGHGLYENRTRPLQNTTIFEK